MRKILFIVLIIAAISKVNAQVQQTWVLSHIAEVKQQVVDHAGNTYHATLTYSEAFSVAATLVIKHDRNGNELWRRFLPALKRSTGLTIDAALNVYVTGIYTSDYFPSVNRAIGEDAQIYTVKLNANGVVQWTNIFVDEDAPLYGYPRSIVVDENGFPYVTGVLYTSLTHPIDSTTSDIATIKYDAATGNRIWVKRYNGSTPGTGFDEGRAMAIEPLGNIYVTGTSQLNGFLDIVTLKYDPSGNLLWTQRFSNSDPALKNDYAVLRGVKLDPVGNVIVIGSSKAGGDIQGSGGEGKGLLIKYTFSGFQLWAVEESINFFSPGPLITDNGNNIIVCINGYTKKYNGAGTLLWAYPGDFGDLVIDADNNIYGVDRCLRLDDNLCGNYYGFTTRKISGSNGVLLWEKTYALFANGGAFIGIDADKNVYTSGSEWWDIPNAGNSYYTIRYSQCEISCSGNITVNAEAGKCDAEVSYPAATTSGYCGSEITYSHASGSRFPVGTTTVTATSTETGATCSFDITVVDNQNPVINYCPSSKSVDMNAGVCYATAASVAAGTATATDNCSATVVGTRSDGQPLTANYPGGVTTITWKATDPSGNSSTCTQTITVEDNEPPVVTNETASTYVLSPPNHTMRDVSINYTITDNCTYLDTTITVTSNEPVNGTGDGDTDPDWIVVDKKNLKLRAERSANGSGRTYTITITATDGSGNATIKTIDVVVAHNIKKPNSGQTFVVGSTINFEGEFWDKPGKVHTGKWVIDGSTLVNGIVSEPSGNQKGKVTGSYKFTAPGVYKLQMNTTDQFGVTNYANTNGDVDAIVVIYDPNGGYAYGGGWYASPAGALLSDPSATGKASYGFAINYRNAAKPKGETQFEFKVGTFEFNALNFEYLSVAGAKAQFRGTGKIIGGQSGVSFIMTVMDGALDGTGVDKIRLKLFKNAQVYYDNQFGANDAANPTTAVGANSIIFIQSNQQQSITQSRVVSETETPNDKLELMAWPNPTADRFSIQVKSNDQKVKIQLQVYDQKGRIVKQQDNVIAGSVIQLGELYRPGVYYIRIIQGKEHRELKLVKLSD